MPELPEVETIRSFLSNHILGNTIADIETIKTSQFHGSKEDATGASIIEVMRKGKVLALKLSNGLYLSIHLKMSGQVLYAAKKENAVYKNIIPFTGKMSLPASTTRIIISFRDGSALFYNDLRRFGWVKVSKEPHVPGGIDVFSKQFTSEAFQSLFDKPTKRAIKVWLLDQDKLAGIGNIYANDALFLAGILPTRSVSSLSKQEITSLFEAINQVIAEGVKRRGSSSRDEVYVTPDGTGGEYQNYFKVYHREGEACVQCKTKIIRIKHGGRSSFYCPQCQR
jgi:formamidopyrimidine-DNA glycosylase